MILKPNLFKLLCASSRQMVNNNIKIINKNNPPRTIKIINNNWSPIRHSSSNRAQTTESTTIFVQKENNFLYEIVHGVLNNKNSTASSLLVRNNNIINNQDDFSNFLNNKDWKNCTATDIVQAFIETKEFCKRNNILISDPRFDKLVDGLMDNCEKLTDKELLDLLNCLVEYPTCIHVNAHNYHDVWSCLDDICCWRMSNWEIDDLFHFAGVWYKWRLSRVSDFTHQIFDRLLKKADILTKDQLVHVFFLFNICRRRAVDFEYENALINKLEEMSVDELAVIALGYFKTNSKVKLLPISEAMINAVTYSVRGIHEISLSAIVKCIRLTQPYKLESQIRNLLDAVYPEFERLSDVACLHVALLTTSFQIFHSNIIRSWSQRMVENLENIRLKELERTLNIITMFNFDPKTQPDIFEATFKEIHKPSRTEELKKYPHSFSSSLYYLSLRGIYSHELMNKILDSEFIKENFGKSPKVLPQQIFFLDVSIDIECPEYVGNRLSEIVRYKAAKWNSEWIPSYDQYKKITAKDRLFLDTFDTLKRILGNDELLFVNHVLPNFPSADCIICKDLRTNSFVKPEGLDQYVFGDIMKSPQDETKKYYAILVLTWTNIIKYSTIPLGSTIMKLRLLKKIGYTPIMVFYHDFTPLTPQEKENYIRNKINQC